MEYKKPQATIIQGNVGIYPLTTADQVILADGTRLEKDGKINVDVANSADSAKLGGKAPEYYIQPRNLLDNSDFTKPVNQRGNTSYSGNTYTIDRWYTYSSNAEIVLNTGYITIQNSALMQKVDTDPDKTYTAAVCKADGSVIVVTGTFSGGFGNVNIGIRCGISSGYPRFLMEPVLGGVKWAALYEGSYTADTLPPYVPKGYAAELAECQRYYQLFKNIGITGLLFSNNKKVLLPVYPKIPMRKTPTISIGSIGWIRGTGVNETNIPAFTINTYSNNPYSPVYELVFESGISIGNLNVCMFMTIYELNADL